MVLEIIEKNFIMAKHISKHAGGVNHSKKGTRPKSVGRKFFVSFFGFIIGGPKMYLL